MARLTRTEKLARIEEERERLDREKKTLLQEIKAEERKARTNRLCKRAGRLESLLPETVKLSDGYFNEFLAKTVAADEGKRILADLLAEQELAEEIAAEEAANAKTADVAAITPETAANAAQTQRLPNAANANKQTA
ncbi:MAG: DUF3847 domain-containing protein [Acidaminococcales bacterium]|jgi:hypothetical protein|nr:DUF3847 domain-containing protein [Acidaminococcales bacterium]